ncbi:MAG: DUF4296 domain-containing protein [Paludibacteraceae bacterium]|nr:DUF4296 domain-containing protein [Paludibacteraceae bacterium]
MKKHNIGIVFLLGLLISLTALSCKKSSQPKDVLPEEKMTSVMIDLYLFDGSASVKQIPVGDSTRIPYYNAILKKHGITLAQYDSSMVWYAKHTPILQKMHQRVVDSLTARSMKLEKK